jgi:CheY-like chemotaxis protein
MALSLLEDVDVVGAAVDGTEAVALAVDLQPDVVLVDLRMPRCDGIEATRQPRAREPGIKVVVLTTYADDRSVIDALQAGARGYLTKDAGGAEIRKALEDVLARPCRERPGCPASPGGRDRLRTTGADQVPTLSPPRRSHVPGSRSAVPHRRRPLEHRDRRSSRCHRRYGQEPHQSPVRQNRCPRPCPGGRVCLHTDWLNESCQRARESRSPSSGPVVPMRYPWHSLRVAPRDQGAPVIPQRSWSQTCRGDYEKALIPSYMKIGIDGASVRVYDSGRPVRPSPRPVGPTGGLVVGPPIVHHWVLTSLRRLARWA